jgi:hypothetical protein
MSVQWPRDEQNRPLGKAGEAFEVSVAGMSPGLRSSEGYTPSAADTVEIVTAVFADESYEGEAQSAFKFIPGLRGQKMQLARALALWGNLSGIASDDARAALDEFERRVQALSREAPAAPEGLPAEIAGVTRQGYDGLKGFVEGGLNHVRKELLKDIRDYRRARGSAAEGRPFDAWLGDIRKKYEGWLSRL